MLAALFAAAAARSVAAPGRPEVIIFDQPADSAGTGQQTQDGQEAALQHAAEEELRKAEESMKGQIDAVTKAEQDVNALTDSDPLEDSGTFTPVLSESQMAQKEAEERQRKAEEAMKGQIDAVTKAEEEVDALTEPNTPSPVLSESQMAQKEAEET